MYLTKSVLKMTGNICVSACLKRMELFVQIIFDQHCHLC